MKRPIPGLRYRPSPAARALLALMLAGSACSLHAASQTWSSTPTDANWATATNWVGGAAPGAVSANTTDIATFNSAISGDIGSATNPILIDAGRTLFGLIFDTANVGAYTIGTNAGNTLRLGSNSATSTTAGVFITSTANASEVIAAPIQLAAFISSTNPQYTFSNNAANSSATLSFTGPITANVSSSRPTKLVLSGSNTGDNIISGNLSDPSFSQQVALLTKSGTGTWILSGTNTFSGSSVTVANSANGIQINAGKLVVQNNNALGSTAGSINNYINSGGTLELNANGSNGSITLNGNLTLQLMSGGTLSSNGSNTTASKINVGTGTSTLSTVNSGDVFTIGDGANDLTGGAVGTVVNIAGPGTVLLSQSNDYAGTFSVNSGTLKLGNAAALGPVTSAGVSFGSGSTGTLALNGNSATIATLASNATVGTPVIENNSATAASLTVSNTSGASTYAGVIRDGAAGGALSLVKDGASTLNLSGANTFTGGTTVSAGTLAANSSGALGIGSVTIASGATLSTGTSAQMGSLILTGGGNLVLTDFSSSFTATGAIDISGTGNLLTLGGSGVSGTTYTLISGSSLSATGLSITGSGVANQTIALGSNTTVGRTTYNFSSTATALTLSITGGAYNLTWNGGNANWNTTDANWQKDGAGSNIAFFAGDNITISTGDTINLNSGAISAGTVLVNNTSGTATLNGSGLSATALTKSGAGDLVVNNVLNSPAGITVQNGNVTLNAANTMSGAISVSGGKLALGVNDAAGSGSATLSVSGGQFDLGTSNQTLSNVVLSSGSITGTTGVLTATGNAIDAQSGTISASLGGTVGLTKSTSGTVILSGTNNYTGATTVSAGTLQIGNGGTTGSIASTSGVTNNATLDYNRSDALTVGYVISGTGSVVKDGAGTLIFNNANTYTGATTINSGTLQIGNGGTTGSMASTSGVTNNAILDYNRSDALTVGYVISGTGSVVKDGAGTLTLSGTNTYAGGTTLNSGTLVINNGSALGSGTLTAFNGTTVSLTTGSGTGTAITLSGSNAVVALTSNQLSVGYTSSFTGTSDQTLQISSGNVVNMNATTRQFSSFGGTVNIVSGGSIADRSSSTTWVNGGDSTLFNVDGFLSSRNGGTWALGGLTGSGTLTMGTAGSNSIGLNYTIGARNDTNDTFSGVIQDGDTANGKTVSVTKVGTGIQTLSGANTYTGTTTISAGTLALGSSGSLASTSIVNNATFDVSAVSSYATGASQTLSGSGTVIGVTVINGTLNPGNSAGVIKFNNDLTLAGTTNIELNSATRGTGYDGVNVGGTLTYGGTLNLLFGSTFLVGGENFQVFTGLDGSSLPVLNSPSFTSIVLGGSYSTSLTNTSGVWTGSTGGYDFTFTESTGTLSVLASAVPEPATYAAISGLVILGVAALRRRRRA